MSNSNLSGRAKAWHLSRSAKVVIKGPLLHYQHRERNSFLTVATVGKEMQESKKLEG